MGVSELLVPSTGIGLYSKVPWKSPVHPSGICAETRVAAARAEKAIADFILIVLGGVWCGNVVGQEG